MLSLLQLHRLMRKRGKWSARLVELAAAVGLLATIASCRDVAGPTTPAAEDGIGATGRLSVDTRKDPDFLTASGAAVALESVTTASGRGTSLSWSHTVSGTDRLLLIAVTTRTAPGMSVTFGGVPMTEVASVQESTGKVKTALWSLVAPATGPADVVVSLSESATNIAAAASSFSGVDQGSPLGTSTTFEGPAVSPSLAVASAPGELVFDALGVQIEPDVTPAQGQVQQWAVSATAGASGAHVHSFGSTKAGAASVQMSWQLAGGSARNVAYVAVPIRPASNPDPAGAPIVSTGNATGVGQTDATFEGTVDPNGAPATAWFEFDTTSAFSGVISTPAEALTADSLTSLRHTIGGLKAGTTYYFRIVADNTLGRSTGDVHSFTTEPPDTTATSNAISLESVTTASGQGTTLAWVHTVSGTDRLLLVAVTTRTVPNVSVTFGGVPLTAVASVQESTGKLKTSLWGLVAPAVGPANVVVTLTASATNIAAAASSFSGVDQTSPLGGPTTFEGTSVSPSLVVPSASGELVFDALGVQIASDASPGQGQTSRWTVGATAGASGAHVYSFGSTKAGAASVQMSWQLAGGTSRNVAYVAVPIRSVGGLGGSGGKPVVSTGSASAIGPDSATLEGTVDSNGKPTTGWFEYSTSNTLSGALSTPAESLTAGSVTTLRHRITALTSGTTYYFRVVAENSSGRSNGSIRSFITQTAPDPTTPPQNPTILTVTAASPTALDLTWQDRSANEDEFRVQWMRAGVWRNVATVPANTTTYQHTGLAPSTTYEYRIRACNAAGCTSSKAMSGSTPAASPPVVSTGSAVPGGFAVLDGTVNPSGLATTVWFEYGTTSTLSVSLPTAIQNLGAQTTVTAVNGLTAELAGQRTYYYRVVAQSAGGISRGAIQSFTSSPGSAQIRLVTFGDSNTDYGYSGTDPTVQVSSYVSNEVATRLPASAPNSPLQLAGKVEGLWNGSHATLLKVVNHGVGGTGTGGGAGGGSDRSGVGAPHARTLVDNVTRYEAEVLGAGYTWSGGEPTSPSYPGGPLSRTKALASASDDFVYISLGTNDPVYNLTTAQTLANLSWMIDRWIGAGHAPGRLMITTLAPRLRAGSEGWPALNDGIRALAAQKGVYLIDLTAHTSNDNGVTWKSSTLHVDGVHYAESVRDWLAQQIVAHMAVF